MGKEGFQFCEQFPGKASLALTSSDLGRFRRAVIVNTVVHASPIRFDSIHRQPEILATIVILFVLAASIVPPGEVPWSSDILQCRFLFETRLARISI